MALDAQANEARSKKSRSNRGDSKTRRKLLALLRQLNEDCKKIRKINDKVDFLENKFMPTLLKYAEEGGMSMEAVESIKKDVGQFDEARDDLTNSCRFLEKVKNLDPSLINAIDHPVQALISDLIFGHAVLLGAVIVGAVVVGFAWNSISSSMITLEIHNNGCAPIPNPPNISALPLVKVWQAPIPSGSSDFATLPPVDLRLDATDTSRLTLYLLNIIPIDVGQIGSVRSVTVNGSEVLHQNLGLDLHAQTTNSVVIACN